MLAREKSMKLMTTTVVCNHYLSEIDNCLPTYCLICSSTLHCLFTPYSYPAHTFFIPFFHSFIHSFIQRTYIVPLQNKLLRGAPSPTPALKNNFRCMYHSLVYTRICFLQ